MEEDHSENIEELASTAQTDFLNHGSAPFNRVMERGTSLENLSVGRQERVKSYDSHASNSLRGRPHPSDEQDGSTAAVTSGSSKAPESSAVEKKGIFAAVVDRVKEYMSFPLSPPL
jgi:hypothetical protein